MNPMDTWDRVDMRLKPVEDAVKVLALKRPHDCDFRIANTLEKGYYYIDTAAHGYLWVPKDDVNMKLARKCCSQFSYKVLGGIFLEHDCDAPKFLKELP